MKIETFKKIAVPFVILVVFNLILVGQVLAADANTGNGNLIVCDGPKCQFEDFLQLVKNVVGYILELGLIFAAIVFAWAGFLYLTAGGKQDQIKRAHGMFTKVIVGLIIALLAYLLVELITSSLGLDSDIIQLGN